MEQNKNPFKLRAYTTPDLFCDREEEVRRLFGYAENGVDVTLFSLRRMGKTGLIQHFFNQLKAKKNEQKTLYVDIYDTQNVTAFTNRLATAILQEFPEERSIGRRFLKLLKSFSPIISFDQFTGVPEVSLTFSSEQQQQYTLKSLLDFLEEQKQQVIVAIDEFQQIANYPEKNVEANLRTIVQQLNNVNFIFSGSHKHLLIEMFNSAKRPFFSSTTPMYLDKINKEEYKNFIVRLFEDRKKKIEEDAVSFILEWTKRHTYYTQALCNKVYQIGNQKVDLETVYSACDVLLEEHEVIFYQYRKLLTAGQWNLLVAIAKDDVIFQPTGAAFVGKYHLGNPASVRRGLKALVDKEMVIHEIDKNGNNYYQVYNCFLSRWLARKF